MPGIDKIIPVDIYVPGCPPRPETVIDAIIKLQDSIAKALDGMTLAELAKTTTRERVHV